MASELYGSFYDESNGFEGSFGNETVFVVDPYTIHTSEVEGGVHFRILKGSEVQEFTIYDGAVGPRGEKGDTGEKGEKGDPGEKGEKGDTGPRGLKGDKGDTGARGERGPQGFPGLKGDPGPKGETGAKGDNGEPFRIDKVYPSIEAMNAGYATDGVKIGGFVIINTSSVEDPDNAKLFLKTNTQYSFVTDLSGATGIRGPKGDDGYSPIVETTEITGGHRVTIIDKDGPHIFDVMDGQGGSGGPIGYYQSIDKIKNYLYSVRYGEIDYEYAKEYFESGYDDFSIGACSSISKGDYYGRNFDWLYDETAEFIVNVSGFAGRHASHGIAAGISGLTNSFVESGEKTDLYRIVPFAMLDGQNDAGLICSTNVVPTDYGENVSVPTVEERESICGSMLVRYILDKFDDPLEACQYIQQYVSVYFSEKLHASNYEQHYMIKKGDSVYCLEFVNNAAVYYDISERPYLTNFLLYGTTLNADNTVYTPYTQDSTHDAMSTNGITENGSGLERWNLMANGYSGVENFGDIRDLMTSLMYTNAYTIEEESDVWHSEFVGIDDLTAGTPYTEFASIIARAREEYEGRSRSDPKTWQTVHSVIYDDSDLTLYVITQEDGEEYVSGFGGIYSPEEVYIGDEEPDTDIWIDTSDSEIPKSPNVRWDVDQNLTDSDKSRARGNIDAYKKPAGGIPRNDLADDTRELFIVTPNVTTYAETVMAIASGKHVQVNAVNQNTGITTTYDYSIIDGDGAIRFGQTYRFTSYYAIFKVDGAWTFAAATAENSAMRIDAITSSRRTDRYTSERAVYDYIANIISSKENAHGHPYALDGANLKTVFGGANALYAALALEDYSQIHNLDYYPIKFEGSYRDYGEWVIPAGENYYSDTACKNVAGQIATDMPVSPENDSPAYYSVKISGTKRYVRMQDCQRWREKSINMTAKMEANINVYWKYGDSGNLRRAVPHIMWLARDGIAALSFCASNYQWADSIEQEAEGDGSTTVYAPTDSALKCVRYVCVNGALQTYNTAYTVNTSTGAVTFKSGYIPASGAAILISRTTHDHPWVGSAIYKTFNDPTYGLLRLIDDDDFKAHIYDGSNNGGMRYNGETRTVANVVNVAWTDRGKMFLPTESEIWGLSVRGANNSSFLPQLPVFANGGRRRNAKGGVDEGERSDWYTASTETQIRIIYVNKNGTDNYMNNSYSDLTVVPGMVGV